MKSWDASLINYLFLFLFFISSFLFGSQNQTDSPMLCYGHASLCDKRLDEVAFASSHNSMSNKAEGWYWPDNLYGLTRQMEAGIRGIVIDVWYYKHSVYMCHSHCQFGKKTLFEGLLEIRDFLEENPNEIFTLFIENYVKGVDIEKDIVETDLEQFVYTHNATRPWPTLRDMINSNQKLIVMISWGDLEGAPKWIYRENELSHITNWDTKTANDFECEATQLNQTANKLYALNHYLLNPYTRQEISETVNYNPLLQDRITQCTQEAGRIPNFVSLTFTEVSNLFEDIDELNGVSH